MGEKIGFIKTTIEFALQREDLRDELLEYMNNIVGEEEKQKLTRR